MTARSWFPEETTRAGAEHLDASYVAAYDRKAGADPTDDLLLLRELGLDETSTLVDFGAGTGELVLAAAPFCGRVIAVDVSPPMLNALRAKAERLGRTNVECDRSGFLTYKHRGNLADFIYSRNALHHLADFWKALALKRIAAMLRPGGVLRLRDLVFAFDPDEAGSIVEAWLANAPDRPEEGWTRSELEAHMREEHSTYTWLLEPMLERAGFEIRDVTHSTSKIFAAYTCVKP
jgi:SAM-dependent methyltransferase